MRVGNNFFAELKRRNVYKVAVAYAIVGWLVIQVAATVVPALHLPEAITSAVVLIVLLGFPVALILAWAFELTPQGIKRTEEVTAEESITPRTGQKLVRFTVALAVIAAALLAYQFLRPTSRTRAAADPTLPSTVTQSGAIPEKSVAVLPFLNLSKEEENAFFADGVQDQILTNLAKVAGLKVISRTSVMQYRNPASRNLREIAQQLGVVHVLEGSVQRALGNVRVTVQLIDARNDAHEWAENYDRPIADVFAIQSEIAKAIAEQLQVRISPGEEAAMSQAPTTDLTAYNLYLKARELSAPGPNDPNGKRDLLEAVRLANEAVARDSQFFLAYCLLALIHDNLYWAGFDHTPARLALEREAIDKAARLQPDAGELHLVRALYAYHAHRDYDSARAELASAGKVLPNDAGVYYYTAIIDRRQGRWDESLRNFDRALQLDPRNFLRLDEAGLLYQGLRRYSESTAWFERALAIRPDYYFVRSQIAINAYFERADIRPLKELARSGAAEQPDWKAKTAADLFLCGLVERDRTVTMGALAAMPAEGVQDSGSNQLVPREWFSGLAARVFGDGATAQAAFASAHRVLSGIVQDQADYAEAWSYLGLIDAGLGRKDDAVAEGRRACELRPVAADALNGILLLQNLAQIYAWTGEKDQALEQLRLAARLPFGINYGELKLHPAWDPLRGDPRFEEIVASLAPK